MTRFFISRRMAIGIPKRRLRDLRRKRISLRDFNIRLDRGGNPFSLEVSRRSTPKAPPHCRKTFFHIPGDEIFLQQLVGELHLVAQADDARAGRQILPAGAEDSGHFSQGQHGLRIAVFPRGAPADSSPAE